MPLRPVQLPGTAVPLPGVQPTPGKGFEAYLLDSLEEVNRLQREADAGVQKVLTGETDNVAEVLTVPPGYDPGREWPLVLGLHGDEGSPEASGSADWRGLAGTGPFIYVAPKSPTPTPTGSFSTPTSICRQR